MSVTFENPASARSATARIWAEIDASALRHNIAAIRGLCGPSSRLIVVVKANAYGHGIECVVPSLRDHVDILAVTNVEEAAAVAPLAGGKPIFLLSPCLPDERIHAVNAGLIVTVSTMDDVMGFARAATRNKKASCVLKIDSGMGRIGCLPAQAESILRAIAAEPTLTLHSISTHLPSADEDDAFTQNQLGEFGDLVKHLRSIQPGVAVQILNSAGVQSCPDHTYEFARVGLAAYGVRPIRSLGPELRPVLTWKARVLQVRNLPAGHGISYGRSHVLSRPSTVATLAAGYADGFPRQVSGRGAHVLIGGQLCPVLGRVTMDQIMVDATNLPKAPTPGDEAVLIGGDGQHSVSANDLATWAGTIAWDIFTGIGPRTARILRDKRPVT